MHLTLEKGPVEAIIEACAMEEPFLRVVLPFPSPLEGSCDVCGISLCRLLSTLSLPIILLLASFRDVVI